MRQTPRITQHAAERWRQRVDPAASANQARRLMKGILAHGRARPTPRHWMAAWPPPPGSLFVYSARCPGVCLIVRHNVVATVVSRDSAVVRKSHRRRKSSCRF